MTVLQQLVVDLGLTVVVSDENTDLKLDQNEPTFREAADLLQLAMEKESEGSATAFVFHRKS
ncbi:hypothetical protein [Pontivivens ytuae]|uniref:hypothetical protein n=1 Tax=Pontivivens ytuae TaxID=2789856 RepID=UPI001E59BBA1|nr:hypothetical protein [Pontivivens ytuae]